MYYSLSYKLLFSNNMDNDLLMSRAIFCALLWELIIYRDSHK